MLKGLEFLDKELSERQFVAGDSVTIADFSIYANFGYLVILDYDMSSWKDKYPNLHSWFDRMAEMPFYNELKDTVSAAIQAMKQARESQESQGSSS